MAVAIAGNLGFLESVDAAFDVPFRQRLFLGVAVVGLAVLGEDSTTPRHVARVELARGWVLDPETQAQRLVWSVLADGLTHCESTDQQICDRLAVVLGLLVGPVP